jgi:glycosyltransferase involved in cell wall biosynthesis
VISPEISVIIPTYNQANYLAEAVQSVLDQSYSNLEVIVVNDASTDHTDEVVGQLSDPRIKYIVHRENRYAASARNTGIRCSSGQLIAFLDADDKYHPEKLQTQVDFLAENPDIGLTYNSRINIDESGDPLSIELAPKEVSLSDLVVGYPFAPSEVVMRREWAFKAGLYDEKFVFNGEDPDFHMRLAINGCKMLSVGKVLNFRRLHRNRVFRNPDKVVDEHVRAFENIFSDPRCPPDVLALRDKSLGNIYMILSYMAFVQSEILLGQELIRKSIRFDRSILDSEASNYRDFIIRISIRDGGDHEERIRGLFAQLPPELEWITQYIGADVARGYLLRGFREIIWKRVEQGKDYLDRAFELGVEMDTRYLDYLTQNLLDHDFVFGEDAAQEVLKKLSNRQLFNGNRAIGSRLIANYSVNRAFINYRAGDYSRVPILIMRSLANNPKYISNRGVLAVLVRSLYSNLVA